MVTEPGSPPDTELVEVFRSAAQQRTDAASLRAIARQVGMSPSGLSKFLDGARPYTKTLARLRAWYLWQHEHPATLSPEEALAALQLLVAGAPASRRPAAAQAAVAALRDVFDDDPPAWWAKFERLVEGTMYEPPQADTRKLRRREEEDPILDPADTGLLS
jgi:hypothetical protein